MRTSCLALAYVLVFCLAPELAGGKVETITPQYARGHFSFAKYDRICINISCISSEAREAFLCSMEKIAQDRATLVYLPETNQAMNAMLTSDLHLFFGMLTNNGEGQSWALLNLQGDVKALASKNDESLCVSAWQQQKLFLTPTQNEINQVSCEMATAFFQDYFSSRAQNHKPTFYILTKAPVRSKENTQSKNAPSTEQSTHL